MIDNTNQYSLQIKLVGWIPHCFVSFNDGQEKYQETEVTLPVYMELLESARIERNLQRKNERNTEHSDLMNETLYNRTLGKQDDLAEMLHDNLINEQIQRAIRLLPKVQRRRLLQYYDSGLTYEQIAAIEGCSLGSVAIAVRRAENRIKEFLKTA